MTQLDSLPEVGQKLANIAPVKRRAAMLLGLPGHISAWLRDLLVKDMADGLQLRLYQYVKAGQA